MSRPWDRGENKPNQSECQVNLRKVDIMTLTEVKDWHYLLYKECRQQLLDGAVYWSRVWTF